ncbi:MAG: 4Fe-4S binding protein [Eubacterium pyruvativorans]|uniref:4Fe-4S binding protein n=1 Tax=Eubacterium pyruvativorans TaxID=155865 RepID=UPI00240910DF|nr:4Fe-4S binding protein [Eubacterium pyruvativorans]MDD6708395.1 4Fe-4S binding protein [Eubacterium pyruvativorans]MDY4048788.1 4Fe-4S binding protein [Eubacterium pyruvativorans]
MGIQKIWSVYFSCTDTTKRMTSFLADRMGEALGISRRETLDFTAPAARREGGYEFGPEDLVVFGMPVYAGRLPNLIMPYVRDGFRGNAAPAVPVVMYGNRNYDDALIELRNLLTENRFRPFAAAAFPAEHSFSRILGAGRPDGDDFRTAGRFAEQAAEKLAAREDDPSFAPVPVAGCWPLRPYFTPRDREGKPIRFLPAKPETKDTCTRCGICVSACPLGSIDPADPARIVGKCMKCCACVKKCPEEAKYFADPGFLYHKEELEAMYAGIRREPETFL